MSRPAYRDARAGNRARIAELRARADERLRAFSPFARALFRESERHELARLQEHELPADDASLEQLAETEIHLAALDAHLAALHAAMPARLAFPPLEPWSPSHDPTPYLIEERWMAEIRTRLATFAQGAAVTRLGDADYGCPYSLGGVPMNLRARHLAVDEHTRLFQLQVRIAVPAGLPRLRMRPEHLGDRVGRWFGRAAEAVVGHHAFDDSFHLEWPEELARVVFDAATQRAFTQIDSCSMQVFPAGAGHATFSTRTSTHYLHDALGPLATLAQHLHLRLRELARSGA